jgi:hypothetical protein
MANFLWSALISAASALLGAVIGTLGTLRAATVATRSERSRVERQAVGELVAGAFDFDAAIHAFSEELRRLASPQVEVVGKPPSAMVAYETVRRSGRELARSAYLVIDAELRRLALGLEQTGWGQVALLGPNASPADLGKVRADRDAVAGRANEVIKSL